MNQNNYIEEVLKNINMKKCQLVGSPFDVNYSLLKVLDEELQNLQGKKIPYKVRIGIYIYAMLDIRVDITLAMNTVTQFMSKVGPTHYMVVEHIKKYMNNIMDFKCKDIVLE